MENIFLETERLFLRQMSPTDFEELSLMLKDPKVMYAWGYEFSDKEVQEWINKNISRYAKYNLGFFLAVDKETSKVVGQAALMPDVIDKKEYYEIGYILKHEHWHKGYARELAKELACYAFNELKLESVVFEIRPENTPSKKVATALGAEVSAEFVKDVKGKKMKHLIYTLKGSKH